MTTPVSVGPKAADAPITVEQGATFHVRFAWIENTQYQSLDGMSARLAIARRQGSAPIVEVTSATGEITLSPDDGAGPLAGIIDVQIAPDKTRLLTRNARYDLVVINDEDPTQVFRLYEGAVVVDRAVTPTGALA